LRFIGYQQAIGPLAPTSLRGLAFCLLAA